MKHFKLVLGILAIFAGNLNASLIHLAAKVSSSQMVKNQLEKGVHPNLRDKHGNTPLHYAKTPTIVSMLLTHGADPNIKNNDGLTPLHLLPLKASIKKYLDGLATLALIIVEEITSVVRAPEWTMKAFDNMGELLLSRGGDPNATDNEGNTPLHDAVRFGKLGLVERLLKYKANPDAKNNEGLTPLHAAVGFLGTSVAAITQNAALGLTTAAAPGILYYLKSRSSAIHADKAFQRRARWKPDIKLQAKASADMYYTWEFNAQMRTAMETAGPNMTHEQLQSAQDAAHSAASKESELSLARSERFAKRIPEYQKEAEESAAKLKQTRFAPKAVVVSVTILATVIILLITVEVYKRNHIVQKLIDAGANVNALDNLGNIPLHTMAARIKFKPGQRKLGVIAAHKLLDAGANPKATNNAGYTPYQIARKNYRLILAAVLKPKAVARRQIRRAWLKGKVETVKGKFAQ